MESTSTRKACFLEDDNGLASIAAGHGFLSSSSENHHNHLLSRPLCSSQKPTNIYASFSHISSPRSTRVFNARFQQQQQQPYFLDACFLCKKSLRGNKDIFMYRGDTAFCSEECRTEQIDNDEEKEKKKWNVCVSMKSMRKKEKNNEKQSNTTSSQNNKTSKNYLFQSGAVAAA